LESGSVPRARIYFDNHSSSDLDPNFIDTYIATEQAAGRYSEAFLPSDLERIIGPFRTSPLGLVPKPGSSKFRMIQDMSHPRGDPDILSINASIDADEFPTIWGMFDSTAALILSLPPGCVAATFDITAAYRNTPIRPDQQHVLCVYWRGKVYVDRAVMFGLTSSAGVFGKVADMLVAIYEKASFGPIRKWVDDFFVIRLPHQSWTEQEFMSLTSYCGVPWSLEKLRPFASVQRYIGFDWDLPGKLVSIPMDKLHSVVQRIDLWLLAAATFSRKDTASLHGKLVHISSIFPLIHPFLRSLSVFEGQFRSPRARLNPPHSVTADLSWVRFLLRHSQNSLPLSSPEPVDINWWGDASTSFGVGVVVGQHWAVWKWAVGFRVGPGQGFDIGWAEAVAVELGLRLALHLGLTDVSDRSRNVFLVRSDNVGIVSVTNKGRSRSGETNRILKHVYGLQARHGIRLHATYVPSRENIADALSRGDITGFLRGFPSVSTKASIRLPDHLSGHLISL